VTAVGYISDSEEIVNASWTNFRHDCTAALKLLERSLQPPAMSAKDLLGGRSQILNVCQIKQMAEIRQSVMRIGHREAFLIPNIGLTARGIRKAQR
jgi:hypothetical protein